MLISVRGKNIRKLENIDVDVNGKSFFIIGESESGKTTFMEIIELCTMQQEITDDILTTGKDEGFIENVHQWDGIKYTISRPLKRGKKTRFTVIDEKGGRHSLETLLQNIFGKAFVNANFDYNQFFYAMKSSEARFNYIVKAAGGDEVIDNIATINKKKRERGVLGTQRDVYETLIADSPIHPDNIESDLLFYTEPRLMDEADKARKELLDTRLNVLDLTVELEVVKEANDLYEEYSKSIISISAEIEELEKQLAAKKEDLAACIEFQQSNPPDLKFQEELELKLSTVTKDNEDIEKNADILYNEKALEINAFNKMRDGFETALINFEKYTEADSEWNKLDEEIKGLVQSNKDIFKSKIPIPGLTIDDVDGKSIVMYEGRELCWENVSKGKSIRLSIEIQKAINPKGNHIVMIPEAQSLGSQLDDILTECKEYGIQCIVEITERKQDFHIEFEEQFLTDKPLKEKVKLKSK